MEVLPNSFFIVLFTLIFGYIVYDKLLVNHKKSKKNVHKMSSCADNVSDTSKNQNTNRYNVGSDNNDSRTTTSDTKEFNNDNNNPG